MTDEELRVTAIEFAKHNKKRIAQELTDPTVYTPETTPVSVFMAGSPGAGKTEFSKNLIAILEKDRERRVIRIDGDELRSRIPGYTGNNSHLFQGAMSFIVEKLQDYALHQKQSFVLDGTFSHYEKAVENIDRSLVKKRSVKNFYVYQKPEVAWAFTQAREAKEGRNIPKAAFIAQFFSAKDVIDHLRLTFQEQITIFLVKKDFERVTVESIVEIEKHGPPLDAYIGEKYTKEELEQRL